MDSRFVANQEGRAHLHRLRAGIKRALDVGAVHDAAGRDHRNIDACHHLRQQLESGQRGLGLRHQESSAMTAGLDTGSDHGISPTEAQACASATVVMVPTTKILAACKRATCAALKISKVKLATAGRSASNISNWALKSSHHLAGIGNSDQASDDQIGRNNSAARASSAWSG